MVRLPIPTGAYPALLIAFGLSLALVLAGRTRRMAWAPNVAMAAGALAGWSLGFGGPRPWRLVLTPATAPQHLVLIALIALGAGLAATRTRSRWLGAGAAFVVGWWVARSPGTGAQFWRAWLAVVLASILLARAGDARRLAAVPLALAAGLLAARASAPWTDAGLVAAAAALPLLASETAASFPLALLGAATVAMADLGAGRLGRGGFSPADLACLIALAAPFAVAPVERRIGRAAPAGPIAVAALAGALAWAGRLALLHR